MMISLIWLCLIFKLRRVSWSILSCKICEGNRYIVEIDVVDIDFEIADFQQSFESIPPGDDIGGQENGVDLLLDFDFVKITGHLFENVKLETLLSCFALVEDEFDVGTALGDEGIQLGQVDVDDVVLQVLLLLALIGEDDGPGLLDVLESQDVLLVIRVDLVQLVGQLVFLRVFGLVVVVEQSDYLVEVVDFLLQQLSETHYFQDLGGVLTATGDVVPGKRCLPLLLLRLVVLLQSLDSRTDDKLELPLLHLDLLAAQVVGLAQIAHNEGVFDDKKVELEVQFWGIVDELKPGVVHLVEQDLETF